MKIFVVGSGKLANAILTIESFQDCELLRWDNQGLDTNEKSILVHAGSGRQLQECIAFCKRTDSVFIELSTGLETEKMDADFTLIVCPNTSVLLLKTLSMIKHSGHYFENDKISITESHQATKTTEPGTAISFAHALKFPIEQIKSIRNPDEQLNKIGIPTAFIDKHAYHKIVIQDGSDEITIETKVLGHKSYTQGVLKIMAIVLKNNFEKKRYSVLDLIEKKML